jgi:hypothetical protein
MQEVLELIAEYEPVKQLLHRLLPVWLVKNPGEHAEHVEVPGAEANVPEEHNVHVEAEVVDVEPAEQFWQ